MRLNLVPVEHHDNIKAYIDPIVPWELLRFSCRQHLSYYTLREEFKPDRVKYWTQVQIKTEALRQFLPIQIVDRVQPRMAKLLEVDIEWTWGEDGNPIFTATSKVQTARPHNPPIDVKSVFKLNNLNNLEEELLERLNDQDELLPICRKLIFSSSYHSGSANILEDSIRGAARVWPNACSDNNIARYTKRKELHNLFEALKLTYGDADGNIPGWMGDTIKNSKFSLQYKRDMANLWLTTFRTPEKTSVFMQEFGCYRLTEKVLNGLLRKEIDARSLTTVEDDVRLAQQFELKVSDLKLEFNAPSETELSVTDIKSLEVLQTLAQFLGKPNSATVIKSITPYGGYADRWANYTTLTTKNGKTQELRIDSMPDFDVEETVGTLAGDICLTCKTPHETDDNLRLCHALKSGWQNYRFNRYMWADECHDLIAKSEATSLFCARENTLYRYVRGFASSWMYHPLVYSICNEVNLTATEKRQALAWCAANHVTIAAVADAEHPNSTSRGLHEFPHTIEFISQCIEYVREEASATIAPITLIVRVNELFTSGDADHPFIIKAIKRNCSLISRWTGIRATVKFPKRSSPPSTPKSGDTREGIFLTEILKFIEMTWLGPKRTVPTKSSATIMAGKIRNLNQENSND